MSCCMPQYSELASRILQLSFEESGRNRICHRLWSFRRQLSRELGLWDDLTRMAFRRILSWFLCWLQCSLCLESTLFSFCPWLCWPLCEGFLLLASLVDGFEALGVPIGKSRGIRAAQRSCCCNIFGSNLRICSRYPDLGIFPCFYSQLYSRF